MTESHTLVRWPRKRGGWTAWHRNAPIDADTHGRTQCGIRWPRRDAEIVPANATITGHRCENCKQAGKGSVPERPS